MGERTDDVRSEDPAEIQADIERTRDDMSETIDEIQHRLSPSHIQEQASQRVRDATVGQVEHAGESLKGTGTTMWETVKQNPLPAALVGVGVGWLIMNRSSSTPRSESYSPSRLEEGSYSGEARRGAGQAAESARHQAQEYGDQMRERTQQMGSMAQERAQEMRGQFGRMYQDNPLALGMVAFGVGAVIGLSVPETRQEHQMMGERRDQLVDQAKDTAQEKMEQAERVAERTAEEARQTAEEEAREQGLAE